MLLPDESDPSSEVLKGSGGFRAQMGSSPFVLQDIRHVTQMNCLHQGRRDSSLR